MEEEQQWAILSDYFSNHGILSHQIDTFNDFIYRGIQTIIDEDCVIEGESYQLQITDAHVTSPTVIDDDRSLRNVFPSECRLRDLSYDAPVQVNLIETVTDTITGASEKKVHLRVVIGRVPIMLHSGLCNLRTLSNSERISAGECEADKGGYFVVKGKERVLMGQLRGIYNEVMVFAQKPADKFKFVAEVRSMSEETGHSVLIQAKINRDENSIVFSIPFVKQALPVGVIFRALGCSDDDMVSLIGLSGDLERFRKTVFYESYFASTQDAALVHIGNLSTNVIREERRKAYAWQIVSAELLPHLGVVSTLREKLCFLGSMVKKLLRTAIGHRTVDDRDNFRNKRVDMAGVLFHDLFRTLYKRFMKTLKQALEKKKYIPDIVTLITRNNSITNGLRYSMQTGTWGLQKNAYVRAGVSQVLSRLSFGASLSHLRRVVTPIGKEGKNAKIRQINQSQIMFICPVETPEGQSVGIVLNLALLTRVSTRVPRILVRETVERSRFLTKADDVSSILDSHTTVYVNGAVVGYTSNVEEFVRDVRDARASGLIPRDVSVTFVSHDNEVKIFCDEGRLIRPVFVVDQATNTLAIRHEHGSCWADLVDKGLVQYLDNTEVESSVIAMTPADLTLFAAVFCEIAPCMMLGVMAAAIPFPNHSQAPRNCYQSSMGKQSLGVFALSHLSRTDTVVHVLDYPQRPLVSTHPAKFMGFDDMPSGINAIVAVMCYTGWNQEDSVLLNKSAVERGMFRITSYRTLVMAEKKRGSSSALEVICLPELSKRRKDANYDLLDVDGIVRVGVPVFKGDVVVGKVVRGSKSDEGGADCSLVVKHNEEGIVDRVVVCTTLAGYKLVKVIIRTQKIPEVGDKFCSRAAQKGTCGAILAQEDLPFTRDGITPDIIINAHCIPSRMTINQLMETVLGKASALDGKYGDATPFGAKSDPATIGEDICTRLKSCGFEKHGYETMYSGFSGEPLDAQIFIGPVMYQRLKHMVSEKIHSRNSGHVTTLTRQPLEGRSRDGGLRFGEMERDCMISHGVSRFLKERLLDQSDPYQVRICDVCGNFGIVSTDCISCGSDKISKINMPYAAKLLIQELNTMGIKTFFKAKS